MKNTSKFEELFSWLCHHLSPIMLIFITIFVVNLVYAYVYFDGRPAPLYLIVGIVSGIMSVMYFRHIIQQKYKDVENSLLARRFDEMIFTITVSAAIIVFYAIIFLFFHLKNFDFELVAAFIIISLTISYRYLVTRYRVKRGLSCDNRHEVEESPEEIRKKPKK